MEQRVDGDILGDRRAFGIDRQEGLSDGGG